MPSLQTNFNGNQHQTCSLWGGTLGASGMEDVEEDDEDDDDDYDDDGGVIRRDD